MTPPNGNTRTHVGARHALIAPDGHVAGRVPGITGAAAVVLISRAMGARFAQLLVTFDAGGRADLSSHSIETAGYLVSGGATVAIGRETCRLAAGGFFFLPAGRTGSVRAPVRGTQLALFQKPFVPLESAPAPKPRVGDAARVKGTPFLGDPDARLKVLLPDDPACDMAMNIFTFKPGATLPFVETHIMEHGLLMLAGRGIYRLEDSWYSVSAGDAIWMGPYCPQWFAATGKAPASYLYYKDVNRAAL